MKKLVNENLKFKRGIKPAQALGLGKFANMEIYGEGSNVKFPIHMEQGFGSPHSEYIIIEDSRGTPVFKIDTTIGGGSNLNKKDLRFLVESMVACLNEKLGY